MKKQKRRIFFRNIIIELLVYSALLVIYFLVVLRYLSQFLTDLFYSQGVLYAVLGLALIVVQAVLLESLTSFLIRLLRLERME
ncbi:MAG: hypothetical protein JW862_06790 [Anaerolineales bacterium]|nr:hypothetical protein [Anaerolineales bacterium]